VGGSPVFSSATSTGGIESLSSGKHVSPPEELELLLELELLELLELDELELDELELDELELDELELDELELLALELLELELEELELLDITPEELELEELELDEIIPDDELLLEELPTPGLDPELSELLQPANINAAEKAVKSTLLYEAAIFVGPLFCLNHYLLLSKYSKRLINQCRYFTAHF